MANSEEKEMMAGFEVIVTSKSQSQAVFIEAVVMPEIAAVLEKYKKDTGDVDTKTVIASTASPFKFTRSVMDAIDHKYDSMSDFELVDELSRIANVAVPQAIEEIRNAKVLHDTVCEVDEMPQVVKNFLKI